MPPSPARCHHPQGGAERCRYCQRTTCPDCHHAPEHLNRCEPTRRREVR